MLTSLLFVVTASFAPTPSVGEKAPDFEVRALHQGVVRLSKELKAGPVVLVVLRGYPGYQCPFCTAQVGEYLGKAGEFEKAKARVLMVYPGPSDQLQQHAEEFIGQKDIPKNFRFTLDPDFSFVNLFGLRWEGPGETAHPATFIIGKDDRVKWLKLSKGHGDRASTDEVLKALSRR